MRTDKHIPFIMLNGVKHLAHVLQRPFVPQGDKTNQGDKPFVMLNAVKHLAHVSQRPFVPQGDKHAVMLNVVKHLPFLLFIFLTVQLNAQQEPSKKVIKDGVELYNQKNYSAAEKKFAEGAKNKKHGNVSTYNRGDASYKLQKYKEAAQHFLNAAKETKDKELRAKSLHNMGNALLQEKDYENALKAYQHALINNPTDEQTRYNLAYTMQMLKKQQQQQNKNQQQQQQQQEKKDDQKDKKDQPKDQQQQQQQQQQDLNKQNAQNMLDALNQNEKNIQKKVKGNKSNGEKKPVEKDW